MEKHDGRALSEHHPTDLNSLAAASAATSKTSDRLDLTLKERFGFESFRPGQRELITRAMNDESFIAVLPTSAGKSLIYQLPAALDEKGITIVISPLIALMRDQLEKLDSFGIPALAIHSQQSEAEQLQSLLDAAQGKAKLLYVAPERFYNPEFVQIASLLNVNRIIVDEAHCVSTWGHDFRPSYQKIPYIRRKLGNPPLIGLTATAPTRILDDIMEMLELKGTKPYVADVDRPNIQFDRQRFSSDVEKREYLIKELKEAHKKKEPTIVYAARRDKTEELANELSASGIPAAFYHAAMDPGLRELIQKDFSRNKIRVLVATKAFGMGIDKPDIRRIYHYDIPESLESYYQEAGRAGRDEKPARCVLMFQPHDIHRQHEFIRGSNPSIDLIWKVFVKLRYLIPRDKKEQEHPSFSFWQSSFEKNMAGNGGEHVARKIRSALSALEEHGIIWREGGSVRFLVSPQGIEPATFPIKSTALDLKRVRAEEAFKANIYYLLSSDDPRKIILSYFRADTLSPTIYEIDYNSMIKLDPKHVDVICRAVTYREYELGELAGYLAGTRKASGKTPGQTDQRGAKRANGDSAKKTENEDLFGALHPLSQSEARDLISTLASRGYLTIHGSGSSNRVALGLKGEESLRQIGALPTKAIPVKYSDLRPIMHSAAGKAVLAEELADWCKETKALCENFSSAWKISLDGFLTTSFKVLNKKLSGAELTAHFSHRTIDKISILDAREFINFVFDGIVPDLYNGRR